MASGHVLKKFQSHYHALDSHVQEWDTMHESLVRLMGTFANMCERFPGLTETVNYGTLCPEVEGIVAKVVGSQTDRLAGVYKEMQRSVLDLEDVCQRMRAVYTRALGFVRQEARVLMVQRRTTKASPVPPVRECLDGIDRIVTMFERETRVCRLLVWRMDGMSENVGGIHVFRSWIQGSHLIDREEVVKRIYVIKASIEDDTMNNKRL
ncbi:hypothetical protein M9434_003641 [Picochlorum sp. BPE23]|nr:hypothetical protein M9434_003641 [Picochlorum sp. BPE23]KAI8113213.1 hypothetical protein M9435_003217 [Picochlorum sp. BPE23]